MASEVFKEALIHGICFAKKSGGSIGRAQDR